MDADLKQAGYDDYNPTWHSVRMFTKVIASQYAQGANSDLPKRYQYEYDLHELWYWVVQGARYIAANHPAQDRLVSQVLHTREMGVLSRKIGPPKEGEEDQETEIATTSDGKYGAIFLFSWTKFKQPGRCLRTFLPLSATT